MQRGQAARTVSEVPPMTDTVSVATMDTAHFTFTAVGTDADHARDVLMAAWRKHAEQTGADPGHVRPDDIDVLTASPGQSFRDGEPFPQFDVITWADGYGRWHAYIHVPSVGAAPSGMIDIARDAIVNEIADREESPGRPYQSIRRNVHVELLEKGRTGPSDRPVRFHYAETL